ncbi:putative RING-H2 finger protein ATL21A [Silene latifolia]|uniref:putative RING-H2 finger protein ATL21A n=1 Tax=Silene latifolia TaxID=37657 RepID=UPI003D77B654
MIHHVYPIDGNNVLAIKEIEIWLSEQFSIKDMGEAAYILGIRIYGDRFRKLLGLSQILSWKSSIKAIVADSVTDREYLAACDAVKEAVWIRNFLIELGVVPSVEEGNNVLAIKEIEIWLSEQFSIKDMGEAAYILGIRIYGDRFRKLLGLSQILSWKSSIKAIVADSVTDREYLAACDAVKEAVWIRNFLIELGVVPSVEEDAPDGKCADHKCNKTSYDHPTIRFPFRAIDRQSKDCGYPGFNVHCDGQSTTLLELPNSIILEVSRIDYSRQEIRLTDPDECLPSKLFNLDLSFSPFYPKYYQEFAVFNCSGQFPNYEYNHTLNSDLQKVDCLSGLNHTVYVVDTFQAVSLLSLSCQRVANIVVPDDYGSSTLTLVTGTITLYWDEPRCGPCAEIGRRCQIQTQSLHQIECSLEIYENDEPSASKLTVCLAVGLPLLLVVIASILSWIRYGRRRNESAAARSMTTRLHTTGLTTRGIDETTIESYPRFVIGDSGRLIIADDKSCPICLSDYQIGHVLEVLPYCQHRFHAACVDQWLVVNGTCPVCRVPPPRS